MTNDSDETRAAALLERLGTSIEVARPPVSDVLASGRHRRRLRHAQVAAVVVGVLVLSGGVTLVGRHLAGDASTNPAAGSTTSGTSERTGQGGLAGRWQPISVGGSTDVATLGNLDLNLDLDLDRSGAGTGYRWFAMDDCNRGSGTLSVAADGSVRPGSASLTEIGCLDEAPYTIVDALLHTSRLSHTATMLTLFDDSGRTLAVFSHDLPGRVPSARELAAHTWIGPVDASKAPGPRSQPRVATHVTFTWHTAVPAIPNATHLSWSGTDCSRYFGYIDLQPSGSFRAQGTVRRTSNCLGFAGKPPFTAVDLVEAARQVRIVGDDLHVFDSADRLIGVLQPVPQG